MPDDSYEKYEPMLNELFRESGSNAWSSGNSTIFYMILIVIFATIIARIFFPFANMLVTMFIFVREGLALFIPVALYYHRAGVYMQDKCLEFDRTHPGFYDAYEEWRRREADKSVSTISGI